MGFDIKWERIHDILIAIIPGRIDGRKPMHFKVSWILQ